MPGQFLESQLGIVSKSYGKLKMCFTCTSYMDLSFLITHEIPRVWLN